MLSACTSRATTPVPAPSPSASPAPSPSPAPSASPAASPTPTVAPSVTASAASAPSNLTVTDAIRAQLVAAGAALNGLSATDYVGLRPGQTYYAYDPASATYWAGAGLVPSPNSQRAQVSVQDDGGYLLFQRPASGSWKAFSDGLGAMAGSTCPAPVPAAILALWHWPSGTCRPAP